MELLNKEDFIDYMNSALGTDFISYVNAIDRNTAYIGAKYNNNNYSIKVNIESNFTDGKLFLKLENVNNLITFIKDQLQRDANEQL